LAAGASFTGTIESVLTQPTAQIEVYSDQPWILYVNQYIDAGGTRLSGQDVIIPTQTLPPYTYNQNVNLPGNYVNVVLINNSTSATTLLNLNITYGPLQVGPRTVTNLGNARNALNEVGGVPITAGSSLSANSLPVVVASDQATLNVRPTNNTFFDLIAEDINNSDTPSNPTGLVRGSGIAADGTEPSLVVSLSPNSTLPIDPSVPLPSGGRTASGSVIMTALGSDGGTKLTDMGGPFYGQATAANQALTGWIDTTGYQSIAITITGPAATATIGFQTTNDRSSMTSITSNCAVFQTQTWASPSTTLVNASAGTTAVTPVAGQWFRVVCTAYTSGVAGVVVVLRSTPMTLVGYNAAINVSAIGGTATVATTPAGMMPVAGNIAPGTAPTANPVLVGGIDNTASGGLTRRFLMDTSGRAQVIGEAAVGAAVTSNPVDIGGADLSGIARRGVTDNQGSFIVTQNQNSNLSYASVPELLTQMVALLRVLCQYTYDQPGYIALALSNPTPANPRTPADEVDVMIADFMQPGNSLSTLFN
jgi:hypothetical protein